MAMTLSDKPFYYGLGIGILIAAVLVGGTWYTYVSPTEDKIRGDEGQIADLDKKIEQGRAAERKLPQFISEVERLQQELEKLRRILPSTRNTEEIIQKLKALVDQGDFILHKMTFPPLGTAKGADPYAEWPISIEVEGRYHDLAILFNRLANYSRIMNVEQIEIKALPVQLDRTISATFTAKTFVYMEPSANAGKEKKKAPAPKADKGGGSE